LYFEIDEMKFVDQWSAKQLNDTDALTLRTITHVLVIASVMGLLVVTTLNTLKDQIHAFLTLKRLGGYNLGITSLYCPILQLILSNLDHFLLSLTRQSAKQRADFFENGAFKNPFNHTKNNSLYFFCI